ncbi:hypothetical protein [Halobacterium hubeiense]|nr:hypothetical protein [Halobacterium hubeiense]
MSDESGRAIYRCTDCSDEFPVDEDSTMYYDCFVCGGSIEKVSDDGA